MINLLNELTQQLDKNIFYFFNSAIKNKVLDLIFPVITRLGEDHTIILLAILLFVFSRRKEKKTPILILVTLFLARPSVLLLKHITHRPRPFLIYENTHLMGKAAFSSFPSGHTTLATAISIILCFKYRKFSLLFISLAILVGISRLYVGQHYPSDVLAGFILGGLLAFAVIYLEKIFQKTKKRIKFKPFFKNLYFKLVKIDDSNQRVSLGAGLGVFCGILPGAGPIVSLILASVFRVNKAAALLGCLITNSWISFVTAVLAVKIGAFIFHIEWQRLWWQTKDLVRNFNFSDFFNLTIWKILLPVFVGYLIIAICCFFLAYLFSLYMIYRFRKPYLKEKK